MVSRVGDLQDRLISDVACLGLDLDFDLELRPYSKNYFGVYNPNNDKIVLYVYQDRNKKHRSSGYLEHGEYGKIAEMVMQKLKKEAPRL